MTKSAILLRWCLLLGLVGCVMALGAACVEDGCTSDQDCEARKSCQAGACVLPPEPVAEPVEDASVPTCPNRCNADRDCVFCGDRKTCDLETKTCINLITQCPAQCNQDSDCERDGCGSRTTCNTDINVCVERLEACPDACTSDADCTAAGCGPRSTCSTEFKTCVDPTVANCPFTCKSDDDCKECGKNNTCSFTTPGSTTGICREKGTFACPSICRTTADCFSSGCGEKVYCNYALRKCVDKNEICPTSCTQDSDCNTNCGSRTFCYITRPGRSGYCFTPPVAEQCPATCRTSYDCKAKGCGDTNFCDLTSGVCEKADDICPAICNSDADCDAAKCGSNTTCRSRRCVP